jgi:polyribonucleotide nucleotidyltransferase
MSLFVSPENQTLIWNVISKNKVVSDYFLLYPNSKEIWFKSIIQIFYEQNKHIVLDSTQLLLLNKQAISYMISNIKEKYPSNNNQKNIINNSNVINNTNLLKSYSVTENKVEKIGNQFNEKKAEYDSLFDKKAPDTIDFAEKQDKPLSNMDELIKQHLKEREDELKKYAPLPLVNQNQTEFNKPSILPTNSSKLKIDTASNINIHIEEIRDNEHENSKSKKSVSWSDNNIEAIERQQLEIELLKKQVIELFEKIKLLEDKNKS